MTTAAHPLDVLAVLFAGEGGAGYFGEAVTAAAHAVGQRERGATDSRRRLARSSSRYSSASRAVEYA